jgi:hypothetical protein
METRVSIELKFFRVYLKGRLRQINDLEKTQPANADLWEAVASELQYIQDNILPKLEKAAVAP